MNFISYLREKGAEGIQKIHQIATDESPFDSLTFNFDRFDHDYSFQKLHASLIQLLLPFVDLSTWKRETSFDPSGYSIVRYYLPNFHLYQQKAYIEFCYDVIGWEVIYIKHLKIVHPSIYEVDFTTEIEHDEHDVAPTPSSLPEATVEQIVEIIVEPFPETDHLPTNDAQLKEKAKVRAKDKANKTSHRKHSLPSQAPLVNESVLEAKVPRDKQNNDSFNEPICVNLLEIHHNLTTIMPAPS